MYLRSMRKNQVYSSDVAVDIRDTFILSDRLSNGIYAFVTVIKIVTGGEGQNEHNVQNFMTELLRFQFCFF